ncbi:hypothetical protein NQD34_015649 [Periophthalmus magnuspinnatus]|nr:hypothetical protein NQD34_015649 [Periophthalmus magnuspinnatus]
MCEEPGATLTVRLVRSFEYCNFRPVVFREVSLEQSVREFTQHVLKDIETKPGLPPPFRKYQYDTMKVIHQAHGAKTNDLVMSLDDQDKPFLQENQTLRDAGVSNETELAFFKKADYDIFKANPQVAW